MLAQANISQVKTSPAGTWTIASAKSTSGTPYSGTVQIHPMGKIYTMSWLTTIGDYCGLAFVEDNYIFAGCAFDNNYGVTLYKINPDGTLDGKWISASNPGAINSEQAVNGIPGQLEGTYKIKGMGLKNDNYQGNLTIIQLDETYEVTWSVGSEYQGVGLRVNDWLIACWGLGNQFALAYELQGYKAQGRWARFGKSPLGEEILEKIC